MFGKKTPKFFTFENFLKFNGVIAVSSCTKDISEFSLILAMAAPPPQRCRTVIGNVTEAKIVWSSEG